MNLGQVSGWAVVMAKILKPLEVTPRGTKGFYIEDPDDYIVAFGGTPAD